MTQKVIDSDPMLSESVRVPISALARQQALWLDQAKESIIKDLSSKAGIWMFFDSSCNFCHSQFIAQAGQKYGMEVRYVSTDGGVINGMSRKGIASIGVQNVPSIGHQNHPGHRLDGAARPRGHYRSWSHEPERIGTENRHRRH